MTPPLDGSKQKSENLPKDDTDPGRVTDPVCGMKVNPDQSPRSDFNGESYFFCCKGCQQKFESDPESFLRQNPENEERQTYAINASSSCCSAGSHGQSTKKKKDKPADPNAVFTCP